MPISLYNLINWLKLSVKGKSYATNIKQISCDCQITFENGNIDGGGAENVISH